MSDSTITVVFVDPSLVRELVTLKQLLDHAINEARHPAGVRHNAGVVLLDSAVERAVYTCSRQLGLPENRDFDKQFDKLRSAGQKGQWPGQVGLEVVRLHNARNQTQHIGLAVNRQESTAWILAATTFIKTLVQNYLGADLETIRLAAAVTDEDLAASIEDAETRLAAGDPVGSVEASQRTYGLAVRRLRSHVSRVTRVQRQDRPHVNDETLALVSSFVNDPTELLWFVDLRAWHLDAGEAEAERALVFTYWLALAVLELPTSVSYERARQYHASLMRSLVGPGPVQLTDVQRGSHQVYDRRAGIMGQQRSFVSVQMTNVPGSDYPEIFFSDLATFLQEHSPAKTDMSIDTGGRLTVHYEDYVDSAAITDALRSGIEHATRQAIDTERSMQQDGKEWAEHQGKYEQSVQEIVGGSVHVMRVGLHRIGPDSFRVHIDTKGMPGQDFLSMEAVKRLVGNGHMFGPDYLEFEGEIPPEVVAKLCAMYDEQTEKWKQETEAKREQATKEQAAILRALSPWLSSPEYVERSSAEMTAYPS